MAPGSVDKGSYIRASLSVDVAICWSLVKKSCPVGFTRSTETNL